MLTLHRSERADVLLDALAGVLATPTDDPFTAEVIAVPARGAERWINQRLALRLGVPVGGTDGDGIAANIEFPSPDALVADAVASASGIDPDTDPWRGEALVWSVLDVLDELVDEPMGRALAHHLGHSGIGGWAEQSGYRARRRHATAEFIAGLLRSYTAERPDMVLDWITGDDHDGYRAPLPEDLAWQPELVRRLCRATSVPAPAQRLAPACAALRAEPALVALPSRISIYGAGRLTTEQLRVISALAQAREVHLWLPHPGPGLWDRVAALRADGDAGARGVLANPENQLLNGLSREIQALQWRLAPLVDAEREHRAPEPAATLLGRLQRGIHRDIAPHPQPDATADGTLEIHACHGPARMVEALRERLVRLFEDDRTLEPREVLIACPEVETFAPLITAAFGRSAEESAARHPGQRLRVRLADRSLRFTNPVLDVIAAVLGLAEGRATVAEVLDLAAGEAVRRRFRFTDGDAERMREWAGPSGARWGFDAAARERFGLGGFPQNTLSTALDRILLGVVADETADQWLGLGLPLDDVESTDIDLVGRYAEYLTRLGAATADCRGRRSAAQWARLLERITEELTDVSPREAWQQAQASREIAEALGGGGERELELGEVRGLLERRWAAKPTRANFRTGELTVCTLTPMRSVPHRVVVLLGLDDEVFPRRTRVGGDDVLGRRPALGERDPRAEDRQLLLDATLSATERLLIFYTGADPVSGGRRPPTAPVAELRDAAQALLGADAPGLTFRHPLQPFAPENFDAAKLGRGVPYSFDAMALAGAHARQRPPTPPPPLIDGPLTPVPAADVDLADLIAFCEHPIKAFLRQRLGFTVPPVEEELDGSLTVESDGLARWQIGDRMLTSRLAGANEAAFTGAELRRGTLPPFRLGGAVLGSISANVERLVAAAPTAADPGDTVDVAVDLGEGRVLLGSIPQVRGGRLVYVTYSRLKPQHRLRAWVELLALGAGLGAGGRGAKLTATVIAQGSAGTGRSVLTLPEDPVSILRQLVALRDRGLTEPLPIFPQASEAYAQRRARGLSEQLAVDGARAAFDGTYGERATDRSIGYLGGDLFERSVHPAQGCQLGALAREMWMPLTTHEELS